MCIRDDKGAGDVEMTTQIENSPSPAEPWIGLVHVRPVPGKSPFGEGVKGAYVQVVALAIDADDFQQRVRKRLLLDDLIFIDIENINRVSTRKKYGTIDNEIVELVRKLSVDRPVQFDIFAPYDKDDA